MDKKIQSGYRQVIYKELMLKGYEFHYTTAQNRKELSYEYQVMNPFGNVVDTPFIRYKNVIACLSHLYLGETDIRALWY